MRSIEKEATRIDAATTTRHDRPLTDSQRAAIRRSLESLVESETNRVETVATVGAEAAAAYDIGLRQAVRDALDKLSDGTYGTCERCHGPIPISRLEAVPYARRCVPCQQSTESGWGPLGGLVGTAVRNLAGEPQGPSELRA